MVSQHGKLQGWLRIQEMDALLICKRENVRYFSGFAGSAGVLVVTESQRKLFTDFRYIEQATETAPDFQVVRSNKLPLDAAAEFLASPEYHRIGFEGEFLTVAEFNRLTDKISQERWSSASLDGLRAVKTSKEIEKITEAAMVTDVAFQKVLPLIRPGIKESDIAAALEYEMRKRGSEKPSFDTIVASGLRAALPHGVASDRTLAAGDFVVVDFGAVCEGYHSDMTRTVCVGTATERQRQVYDTVLRAQMTGLAAVRSGALCREVDQAGRKIIEEAGYGDYFGHGLGHCVGLAIHENPRLSMLAGEARLEAGMVVTVEPGIYLPGWGGVRIEDLIVVTEDGCRILSQTDKGLLELG